MKKESWRKRCPFCGGEAVMYRSPNDLYHIMHCRTPYCRGNIAHDPDGHYSALRALEEWNRRADGWTPCNREEDGDGGDWYGEPLPDDGQAILVSYEDGSVEADRFACGGDEVWLEGGGCMPREALAWMPAPKPYAA